MRRWAFSLVAAAGLLLGGVGAAHAQATDAPPNRAQLERRVRQVFLNRLRQELRLTPDEVEALQAVIRWSEAERQQIAADTRILGTRVTDFLRAGGMEQEARELLEIRVDLQAREAALFRAEQDRLLEVMSPPQVVRFYEIRDELNDRIRRLRAEVQRRRGGG